jgi:hypothetical protein
MSHVGRGAVSVFALVPHPEQVPHSRVSLGAGCARLVLAIGSYSLWSGPRGATNTCGAASLSDTFIVAYLCNKCVMYMV